MTSLMLVAALAVADSRIESLIARMTVEEKVAQIVQPVFRKDGLAKAIAAAERGEFGTCIWFPSMRRYGTPSSGQPSNGRVSESPSSSAMMSFTASS